MAWKNPAANVSALVVDENAIPVQNRDTRIQREKLANVEQGTGEQQIVGVDPAHDVACRAAESGVNRVCLPAVGRDLPPGQLGAEFLQHCGGFVGGAAVLHKVFQARIVLLQDALYRLAQERSLLKRRRDERNGGQQFRPNS